MTIAYPHRIRLRGPWECEPVAALEPGPQGQFEISDMTVPGTFRVTMPCRWHEAGLKDFQGQVRFRRRFGYPGQIDEDERVWLTFAGWTGTATIELNGELLLEEHDEGPCEFDVTSLLRPSNELIVELESTSPNAGVWGEVALEIRTTAYLKGVVFELHEGNALEVKGKVVGLSPRPLDLYLLVNNQNIHHTTIEPSEAGTDFQITKNLALPDEASPLLGRVELIDGGTVWYVVEEVFG